MLLLPVLLPHDVNPWIEGLIDATLLGIGSLPLLWLLLIRPMYDDIRKLFHHSRMLMATLDEHALVSITDAKGRITHANASFCRISQLTLEELVGRDHRVVNSGVHPKSFMKDLWDTVTRGDPWHGEVCNQAKDGSRYWVDATIVPFKDEHGRITQYVAIRSDITGRKQSELELEVMMSELSLAQQLADSANQAKSTFLANMSHEIRTPMTAILGFAENMLDPDQSESEKLSCVHTIRRNGEYLIGLINDILDLSKVEAGKMTVEKRKCHLCQIIAETMSLMRVRSDAKGLTFNIEYVGAVPETIMSDPTRLRQILINLIGNAIKFTENGGVRLVTRFVNDSDAQFLQFDVIDAGRGMTPEQVAKLFQPFTQADNSTTRKFGGTGLGLTISKRFAELLGGDIIVAASELGVGSTFRATVVTGSLEGVTMLENPLSATVVEDSPTSIAQVVPSDLHDLRILLAEDGPDNQRLITFVLKKAGAEVTVVDNGKLALDAALSARDEGKPFDAILMDMQMPVMDGYEATGQLRNHDYCGPIIALTAHAMESDREQCIKAGCDDYATKPIDRKKLIETLQRHLVPAEVVSATST